MMNYSREQIYKIFSEMVLGKERIYISGRAFNCTYNFYNSETLEYVSIKNQLPVLHIKNVKQFSDTLYKYVDTFMNSNRLFAKAEVMDDSFKYKENKLMFALTNLFVNAGFEDFENINNYVKQRTDFLNNNLIESNNQWRSAGDFYKTNGAKLYYRMAENNCALETPDRLEVKVERQGENGQIETVLLPSISFGISGDTAYVFTSQMPHNRAAEKDASLLKKVERARYKVNENIPEDEQTEEPFSIISATALTAFLAGQGVNKIYVNNFLPMRYSSKKEAYERKAGSDPVMQEQLATEQQRIQENLTEKFLGTFFRVEQQTGGIEQFSNVEPGFTIFSIKQPEASDDHNEFLSGIYNHVLQNHQAPEMEH